jgi:hypothetical protein
LEDKLVAALPQPRRGVKNPQPDVGMLSAEEQQPVKRANKTA